MTDTLLAAKTGADQSDQVSVTGERLPYVFSCAPALPSGEAAQIQYLGGNGTFYDLFVDGNIKEINSTNSLVPIYGPGIYRVDKESTAAATGVFGWSENEL